MTQNEKDREWLDYVDEEIRKKRTIDRGFFYFSKYGNWQTDYSQSGRMRMLCISLTLRKTECETNLQKKRYSNALAASIGGRSYTCKRRKRHLDSS
ncbi:hypothetical protein PCORN_13477 [Listeria cornellensis FSL F6-0969]|uniref:Uncharacterized protein n=1 Tax=Listeria cornellensis FSL F6-0969 TaxID=1265820 RepID=W7C3W2_9LIST|nr:hypothetical protein PCORN_13477 [Listeria cornellensis FSL F6-0969]